MQSSLPENVNNTLSEVFEGLMSSINQVRSQAERQLENDWFTQSGLAMLLLFLAEQAVGGSSESTRAFAAVIFRRYALRMPPGRANSVTESSIGVIDESVRAEIRNLLYNGFFSDQTRSVRHKLADAVAEIAFPHISPPGTWDQLLPTLFEATSSQDSSLRESAFRVFGSCPVLLIDHLDKALPALAAGFDDSEDAVKQAASKAFVAAFQKTPKKEWGKYSVLLPGLLNALPKYLEDGNEDILASEFESLIDLVLVAPKMFRPMLPTIIAFCSTITKNTELDSRTRLAALELLTTFAEASPSMCRAEETYPVTIVELTLQLMTEICIDDDEALEWQNVENRDLPDEEEDKAARNSLDRVALHLRGKVLAGPLFKYLTQMLSSSEWRERQAALMALSAAAEGCSDVLMSEMSKILDLILPLLRDPHPRVQYACCNALGQISTDFADSIQRKCGNRILPALISMLTVDSVPRVQTHAAAALVNFSENASKEILEPYLDDLLSNLLTLLQAPHRVVQEQVLTTIAVVADAAETQFIKYYDALMPLLINFLKSDFNSEDLLLKGKSLECSSLIAQAVGKEKFSEHSQELIDIFTSIQKSEYANDEIRTYLEQSWNTICSIIGTEFTPYLPLVLPPIIESGKAEQIVKFVEESDDLDENSWDIYPFSGKRVAINTAILEDKVDAIDLLKSYAEILKGAFYPYVGHVVQEILLPALDFYFHDGVRQSAAAAFPVFLQSAKAAPEATPQEVSSLWDAIASKLIESIVGEQFIEVKDCYFAAFARCVMIMGDDSLSDNNLSHFVMTVNKTMQDVYARIKERDGANNNGEEDFGEGIDEENDEFSDEELLDEINKAVSGVFKFSKFKFLNHFQELVPSVQTFLEDDNTSLKLCGLCMISDLVEHAGPNSAVFKDIFINCVGESLSSPTPNIREIATYIIGVAATNGGVEYSEFVLTALEPLFKMISVPDAKLEDNIIASEYAIASIAKVLTIYNSRISSLDDMIDSWIQSLPVIIDTKSAQVAYGFLAGLVTSNHPSVQKNVDKIIHSVLQTLIHGCLSGKPAEDSIIAVKSLLGSMPQQTAMSYFEKYNAEQQSLLQEYFS